MGMTEFSMGLLLPHKHPLDAWCKAGHYAPETWVHPETGKEMPRTFYAVSGDCLDEEDVGVYCGRCVALAQLIAKLVKKRRKEMRTVQ